ncbi:hypothetical protein CHARACLAT_000901 [Characodon lateralis]|uniref:Uncharacterized protein n=1 Tax=Characodon lateralis TaxID=208331 RepID=A0ABU7DCH6_9TELE|nr:hypothetical protein [Characodon lateralis]
MRPSLDSAIYKIMKEKGGDDCVECALIWEDKFGFPQGGSLSVNQLIKVKQLMDGDWEKKKNKKKIKKQDLDQREIWVKCWNEWITEAMHRERKSELKQMAGGKDLSGDVGDRYDNAGHTVDDPTFPLPYRPSDASLSCPYASSLQMELQALQMAELDLDSRPPPAADQPANLPASQPSQLASLPEHQPTSLPTHPPAA